MNLEILYSNGNSETILNVKSIKVNKNGDLTVKTQSKEKIKIECEKVFDFEVKQS